MSLPSTWPPSAPASSPSVRKICSLWVHSPAFSRDEVLFNAAVLPRGFSLDGQLLKILPSRPDDAAQARHPSRDYAQSRSVATPCSQFDDTVNSDSAFVFIARDLTDEQRSKYPNLQISVSEAIASCHGFQNRMSVLLVAAAIDDHAASHVELNFKDPLDRDDLWKVIVSELHRKQCLYEGQKLLYLGSIEFSIRKIYVNGQKAPSAVFTELSKPIFRSLAARYVLGVQISRETNDFDQDTSCDIKWVRTKAFLAELFERWDAVNAKHSVSIFLFARLSYPSDDQNQSRTEDFYRVITSELASSSCKTLLPVLDREYRDFLHDIAYQPASSPQESPVIQGELVPAKSGNFLEAINLAAAASLHDDIDLDFVRTGTLALMLTSGPAVFDVEKSLLRMTDSRLIARQIGVELVSTAMPPLHVAPLFVFASDRQTIDSGHHLAGAFQSAGQHLASVDSQPTGERPAPVGREHTDEPHPTGNLKREATAGNTYVMPSWIETSFYEGPKAKTANPMNYMSYADEMECRGFRQQRQHYVPESASFGIIFPQAQNFLSKIKPQSPSLKVGARRDKDCAIKEMQRYDETRFKLDISLVSDTSIAHAQSVARKNVSAASKKDSKPMPLDIVARPLPRAEDVPRAIATHHLLEKLSDQRPASIQQSHDTIINKPPRESQPPLPTRRGLLYGKASATTGSTVDFVKFSKNATSSTLRFEDLQSSPSTRVHTPLPRQTSLQSVEQPTQSLFGMASSYSRRIKISKGPAADEQSKTVQHLPEDHPWFVVKSPFKPRRSARKTFGEWNHVSPRQKPAYSVKWKALCTPAALPSTTSDFPSSAQLRAWFTESPYKVAASEESGIATVSAGKRARLARELIQSRISDGFQIAIGKRAHEITNSDDLDLYAQDLMSHEGDAVLLIKGDDIQLLCVTGSEVAVTRFQRRHNIPKPILYHANIRTALDQGFRARRLVYSQSSERNWSTIDNDIASYEMDSDERMTHAAPSINGRRARFVLIPVQPSATTSTSGSGLEDSDEEIRIEGIRKLTMLWQKNRWLNSSMQRHQTSWSSRKSLDLNPLAIEYHTRDPSAVVAAGLESLVEGEQASATTQLFNESELWRTSHVDLQKLSIELQSDRGIPVKTRRWHLRLYEFCFVGTDFTTFLLANFQDLATRDEAVEFGNALMQKGLFHHVHGKHAFRDGQYFYSVSGEYRVKSDSKSTGWFGGSRKERTPLPPSTPLSDRTRDSPDTSNVPRHYFGGRRTKVCLNASLQFKLDPRKASTRMEVITIHYDRLHNPENAFHFEIEWIDATARLVEDALTFWATSISKFGLNLVQLPVAEASLISDVNPLRAPYTVELALKPPVTMTSITSESPRLPPQKANGALMYQKAILRKFNFVLDFEAMANFPADVDVTYTWGTRAYRHAQYIHRTGLLLAQILSDTKFILVANRFSNNNRAARNRDHISKESSGHKLERERRAPNSAMPRPSSALLSQPSPVSSPLMRAVAEPRASPLMNPPTNIQITAERLKDRFEEFCKDARSLKQLYDEVTHQAASMPEKPTPALSATSTQDTSMLQTSIPSLDIRE